MGLCVGEVLVIVTDTVAELWHNYRAESCDWRLIQFRIIPSHKY